MASNENENDAAQVYLLGKTYLANNQGQFYIRNDPIVHMAAGDRHTIIVTESGRAFAFGDNSSGQLGLGHTNNVEKVSCIKSLKSNETGEKVILAACGRESSLVATNRGTIYAFGSNSHSQLGIETSEPSKIQSQPVKIEHLKGKKWKQISMGAEHTCALTDDGVVYVWGANDDGQCGQTKKDVTVTTPRELRIKYGVKAISCGYYHTALLSNEGQLYLFGNNEDRQLGHDVSDKFAGPQLVSISDKVAAVACGNQHTLVLTENGQVYACGLGDRGQLGLGPRVFSSEHFELIPGLPKRVTSIAAGEAHSVVIGNRNDMYVFGDGKHGKLLGLSPTSYSNEVEPCFVDKFKSYNVLKAVCGGCQTIVLAQKKNSDLKKNSGSDEDNGNETLSVTQRPKSLARSMRNKNITERSNNFGDSVDTSIKQVRPLGNANNLRIESDDEKSDKELSESLRSATFNKTHTITNGKFRPTQTSSLTRNSFRSNDDDLKPLKTGALDRTARLNRDSDDLIKTATRIESPSRNDARFDRPSPSNPRKKPNSDDDKSSSEEERPKTLSKKLEQPSPRFEKKPSPRIERKLSPVPRRRDDSDSDDYRNKRPSPVKKPPMSETLPRKTPQTKRPNSDDDDDDDDQEDEDENRTARSSSRPSKQPPPVARRSSLPHQARAGPSTSTSRDGNQTIGSRPSEGVRGSVRTQATKTLAKPTPSTETPKKETPPDPQPGFFSRLFGSKPTPPPAAAPQPAPTTTTPATNASSRTCSVM